MWPHRQQGCADSARTQIIALGGAYIVAVTALDTVTNVGAIDDLTSTARIVLVRAPACSSRWWQRQLLSPSSLSTSFKDTPVALVTTAQPLSQKFVSVPPICEQP